MYRLLIVDDEAIIADGLYEVFKNLEEVELDIYKVYSTQEALTLLSKTRVDILLTDIKMPGMDGLQLVERIKAAYQCPKIIFLTGYDAFEYIYSAIQYDRVSYILKAEGYDKVIETVKEAIKELDYINGQERLLQKAEKQFKEATLLLQKDYLVSLIKGELFKQEINEKEFEKLNIPLKVQFPVVMLIGRVDSFPKNLPYAEKSKRLYEVALVAEEYFSTCVSSVYFISPNKELIWLFQPMELEESAEEDQKKVWHTCCNFIKGTLELIQDCCMRTMNILLSFALDDCTVEWDQVAQCHSGLQMLINCRIGKGTGMLLTGIEPIHKQLKTSCPIKDPLETGERQKVEQLIQNVTSALECGYENEFNEALDEMMNNIPDNESMHNVVILEWYYAITLPMLSYINKWQLIEKIAFKIGLYPLMSIEYHCNWKQAFEYLKSIGKVLFELQDSEQEKRALEAVNTVQKHIRSHINDQYEISLIHLAELVYFNPSYLSRLFKQVVGMNLSDYVCEIRIKKAKELLENKNEKIQSIAESVGYGSATNFTRFFKKVTNMTPQEYRDMLYTK